MLNITKYYKNSNTGEIICHEQFWWTFGHFVTEPKLMSEFWSSPLTKTMEQGKPDLTGYVPLSERRYNHIVKKNLRKLKHGKEPIKRISRGNKPTGFQPRTK